MPEKHTDYLVSNLDKCVSQIGPMWYWATEVPTHSHNSFIIFLTCTLALFIALLHLLGISISSVTFNPLQNDEWRYLYCAKIISNNIN